MKKLFTNDKFFFIVMLVDVIGGIIYSTIGCVKFSNSFSVYIPLLFSAICSLVLYIAYIKHSKNVMKGMMSALLTARIMFSVSSLGSMYITIDYICNPIAIVLTVLMFINHFIINSDHHSSPKNVAFNQILAVLVAVNAIVWGVAWLPYYKSTIAVVMQVIGIITSPAICAIVVCVESRLDAYRLDREAAGWTEEKGYPEGYVHEYEKK